MAMMLHRPIIRCAGFSHSILNIRGFHVLSTARQNEVSNNSLFGSITKGVEDTSNDPNNISNRLTAASGAAEGKENAKETVTVENDKLLQSFITKSHPIMPASHLLSPLKRRIYKENCKLNGGFYKKDTIVSLAHETGQKLKYQLNLSREEIEVLEPSVYVKSYRIKSSMKKATHLLRLLNGLDAKEALTQCHFSDKKIARDVADVLSRGIKDAEALKLQADDLYIAQIWTGSDGWWQKRIDIKARGRNGVITHPYVHVRCILKSKHVTKNRLAYESQLRQQAKKPWVQLSEKPVRGAMGGAYKW